MTKPDLEKATKEELVAFIAYQESVIGGVPNLIAELKVFSDILAKDVKRANEGKTDGFILLDDSQKLSRILNILKNLEYFEALESGGTLVKKQGRQKKTETEPSEVSEDVVKPVESIGNAFEIVSAKIKSKINGTAK